MRPPAPAPRDQKRPTRFTAVLGLVLAAGLFGGTWFGVAPTAEAPSWTLSGTEVAGVPAPSRVHSRRRASRGARRRRLAVPAPRRCRAIAAGRARTACRVDTVEPWRAAFIGRAPPR